MSGAAPVVDEGLNARALRESTHGGMDGLTVQTTANPLARTRRPVTTEPEHDRSEYNSDFDEHSRSTANPMHAGARGSDMEPVSPSHLGLPDHAEPAKHGWGIVSGVKKALSSAGSWIGGVASRGFHYLRSSLKGAAGDYSDAVNTLASTTVDPLLDRLGTQKPDPKVDTDSLGWKSRAKQSDGTMALTDPNEIRMHGAVHAGKESVKDLLHDSNSGLSDDERADMVRKHLLKTHKLKQSGEGDLYAKHIARARAQDGTTATALAGQALAEGSEGVIRVAGSGPAKYASHVGTVLTAVSASNVVKNTAMMTKVAGQYALDHDQARQERADKAAAEHLVAHQDVKKQFGDYRSARGAWAGQDDANLSDDVKALRSSHLKANYQGLLTKVKANKEDVIARSAAGRGSELLDEMKMKHTNAIDKKTGQAYPPDQRPAGVHPQYGMPMGTDTAIGRTGQNLRTAGGAVEFGGKMITGKGAQEELDKGNYKAATAISMGGLATEAATAIGAGTVPIGGGHATKTVALGIGYGAMGAGKLAGEVGGKMASQQDQRDRYMDVISGDRSEAAGMQPINFRGAEPTIEPEGVQKIIKKTRDGARDQAKKTVRNLFGARG